jgi:Fe-S oxidoreductase
VELLNEIRPRRIVTTCPHCLHTLKNEYPAFGGNYEVVHHTQLINELIEAGKLPLAPQSPSQSSIPSAPLRGRFAVPNPQSKIAFHDPCYLGRHNRVYAEPRQVLREAQADLVEMPRHADQSFCCGAGGTQMWKEEEHGTGRVSAARLAEAKASGAGTLAVGCPFCMIMLTDAAKADGGQVEVKDVAEVVAERLKD